MPNVDTKLCDHVSLELECLDRLYLCYQPLLQAEGSPLHFLLFPEADALRPQSCAAGDKLAPTPTDMSLLLPTHT